MRPASIPGSVLDRQGGSILDRRRQLMSAILLIGGLLLLQVGMAAGGVGQCLDTVIGMGESLRIRSS